MTPPSTPRKPSKSRPHLESCSTVSPTASVRCHLSVESDDFTWPHAVVEFPIQEKVHDGRSSTPPAATATTSRFRSPIGTRTAAVCSGTASPVPKQRSDTPPPTPRPVPLPMPPLMKALARQSLEQVQQVLEVDPSAAQELFWDHHCEPPLCCAARFACSPQIFTLLLQHGADVGALNRHGRTPLGILSSEPYVVQPLPGITLGAYTIDPMNTVQVARQQNNLEVTRLLIKASADVKHVDLSGSSPMDHAVRAHNQPLIQVLIDSGCREAVEAAAAVQGAAALASL